MDAFFEFVINHWFLWSLLLLIIGAIFWLELRGHVGGVIKLQAQAMVGLMNREAAKVVDVRDSDAFNQGHIIKAVNIPMGEFDRKPKKLEKYKSKPVIVVCNQGVISAKAGVMLRKLGFEKVYVLDGGMKAWREASLPTVQGKV